MNYVTWARKESDISTQNCSILSFDILGTPHDYDLVLNVASLPPTNTINYDCDQLVETYAVTNFRQRDV